MNYTLITGATEGIGYELAKLFAGSRHNLILVSRHEEKLSSTANGLINTHGIEVITIPIDLSLPGSAQYIYDHIVLKTATIDYLVNNAGFYIKGRYADTSWEEEQKLIHLQCNSYPLLVKLLLPDMIKSGTGGILNLGSTGSFVPGPYNTIYCAVKSFVLSFSEALAEELSGTGIHVTALCPGGTRTRFQDYSQRKKSYLFPIMEPSIVAKIGFQALLKNKRVVIPGVGNKFQVFTIRVLPRLWAAKLAGSVVKNEIAFS